MYKFTERKLTMNILVTLNSGYIGPLSVMLKSIMINNPEEEFDLFVAHSSLTDEDFAIIQKVIDKNRTTVHPIVVPSSLMENAPVLKRISKETYYRLLVLDIIPQSVDKILYMDPDIVVNNSLKKLYEIPMGDAIVAGAGHTAPIVETYNKLRLDMPKKSRYVNAGVLMLNLEEMRKFCTTQDIFDYIAKNIKKLYLSDQDVINGMFGGRTVYFDTYVFNLDERVFKRNRKIDIDWVRKNTSVIHYNGSQKPWKSEYKGKLAEFYFYYKKLADKDLKE
ncbi:MAG: glycosyltransferase family 8 protein [Ruminococcaceae bacterium]|nr:glycosyltransferase family 8 protein [Oscillospiraceae bacterium]